MNAFDNTAARVTSCDWPALHRQLDREGYALTPTLLDAAQRAELISMYDESTRFRSRVIMQRHSFGRGEYQYFAYPLPPLVQALRMAFYAQLAPLANAWMEKLGSAIRYPARLDEFLARCHAQEQKRPTPLLLRYGADDYNCLHQDLYGEQQFPLQVIFQLSEPARDFGGGELVLVEQRPRLQSIPRVVPLAAGSAAIIAVRERPVAGTRGWHRTQLRHGVSRVTHGQRHTLGIVLHDAA
ncbi:MAG: 2OG-Fe(II) oxygenase [Solimonas sp.]